MQSANDKQTIESESVDTDGPNVNFKHTRACPECGKIVEWTRHPRKESTMPNGKVISVIPLSLECPEHGPFDNVSSRMNDEMARVLANLRGERRSLS